MRARLLLILLAVPTTAAWDTTALDASEDERIALHPTPAGNVPPAPLPAALCSAPSSDVLSTRTSVEGDTFVVQVAFRDLLQDPACAASSFALLRPHSWTSGVTLWPRDALAVGARDLVFVGVTEAAREGDVLTLRTPLASTAGCPDGSLRSYNMARQIFDAETIARAVGVVLGASWRTVVTYLATDSRTGATPCPIC